MTLITQGLFPKDTAKNLRFSINYFTAIGLGILAEPLREYLKNHAQIVEKQLEEEAEESALFPVIIEQVLITLKYDFVFHMLSVNTRFFDQIRSFSTRYSIISREKIEY